MEFGGFALADYLCFQSDKCCKELRRMKVISFFSAKGGTGKTTFNVLLASYIKYRLGKRVMILDFDYPEHNLTFMRQRDLKYLESEGILFREEDFYPIEPINKYAAEDLDWLTGTLNSLSGSLDYLILDFPGSFASGDTICELVPEGYIDLMVLPVELDAMIIASMKSLAHILRENGQRTLLFFNRVCGRETKAAYGRVRDWFAEEGSVISENYVKQSVSMKKEMDDVAHVRSTVDFPTAYSNKRNPGIVKLFEEVLKYADMEKEEETA